jgi:hypothetical protein
MIDPYKTAVLYYFGDLEYWKLPGIAADALEQVYDGPALRRLAGLANPVASDIRQEEVDSAFREMGAAPLTKDEAKLVLAAESARKAVEGDSNVFDAATHIRIHLCGFQEPAQELRRIVTLSKLGERNTPSTKWPSERELKDAMAEFLRSRQYDRRP